MYSAQVVRESNFYWLSAKVIFLEAWYQREIFIRNFSRKQERGWHAEITCFLESRYYISWLNMVARVYVQKFYEIKSELKFKDNFTCFSWLFAFCIVNCNWRWIQTKSNHLSQEKASTVTIPNQIKTVQTWIRLSVLLLLLLLLLLFSIYMFKLKFN